MKGKAAEEARGRRDCSVLIKVSIDSLTRFAAN